MDAGLREAPALSLRHHAASPCTETLRKARRLVDDETGIIRILYEAPIYPDAPRIFGCAALAGDHSGVVTPWKNDVSGSTSLVRDQAIAGAIGEAVERYSAAYVPTEEVVLASHASLGPDAVAPSSLVMYDESQYADPDFPYRPVHPEDSVGWVTGYSLRRHRPVYVPAFAVYQPYRGTEDEEPVVQQVTTGLACGNTPEEAILAAVCEIVERDAAMLMWLQMRRPPRVSVGTDAPGMVLETLSRFGAAARHVTLLDITSDILIPAYVAVWDGPLSGQDGAIFASCAKPERERAAVGALTELAQCMMWAGSLVDSGDDLPDPASTAISRIEEHVLWPLRPSNRPAFEFALAGRREVGWDGASAHPSDDVLDALARCVELVAGAGLDVIVCDVTSPDVAEAGLHVFRAVIPGAQPLYFGSGLHRLSRRARDCPYPDRAATSMNLYPHPFP